MKKTLPLLLAPALALAGFAAAPTAFADVVRPAPDFTLAGGKSLRTLRGQPVVVVIAPSPESKIFRKQVKRLEADFQGFAARNTVFIAAFTESSEGLHSSIPFSVARDGAKVAAGFGVTAPFSVIVVGKDGNVDLKTDQLSGSWRVRDAILNNYENQAAERRL